MTLFAVAMVGLATAQDLVLLFVFFDLTAVCSYYLIGFDRGRREARTAALTALLVTVVSAVAMLIAAMCRPLPVLRCRSWRSASAVSAQ